MSPRTEASPAAQQQIQNLRQGRAPGTKQYSPAAAKPTFGRVRVASGIKTAGIERFEAEVPECKQREYFGMV